MSFIEYKVNDGIAIICMNRPDKYNSYIKEMAVEMQKSLDDAEKNSDVRAIYITGNGRAFCAGQDLGEIVDPNGPPLSEIVSQHFNPIIDRIRTIEKPIVGAVNGVAAGAGANIALSCDITVATSSASFIQAFSKIGLIPDSGGTFFLPRLVGRQQAAALMMLGNKISADHAQKMGMIYAVYDDKTFAYESMKLAKQLAQMPTVALGLTKRALNASLVNNLTEQLALEDELQVEASKTHDYKEGVDSFLEKRPAIFKGH